MTNDPRRPHPNFPSQGSQGVSRVAFGSDSRLLYKSWACELLVYFLADAFSQQLSTVVEGQSRWATTAIMRSNLQLQGKWQKSKHDTEYSS